MDINKVKQELDQNINDIQQANNNPLNVTYVDVAGHFQKKEISLEMQDYTGREDELTALINKEINPQNRV